MGLYPGGIGLFEKLNERLAELKEKGRNKEKWERRLKQLKQDLSNWELSREEWRMKLALEENDVQKLMGMSLSNLFYTILGSKKEKLDQEQRDVLEARLKFDECESTIQDIKQQIAELEPKWRQVRYWKMDYESVFETKEKQILKQNQELMKIADERAKLTVQLKELKEAISVGETVRKNLTSAENDLESAANWGTYDMLGGGMVSTHIKHNRIDEAMNHIYEAQNGLARFENELHDVGETLPSHLKISGVLKFSDYFFDGLISDWLVQGEIRDMLDQVQNKLSEVDHILGELESMKNQVEAERGGVDRKYVQIVEEYS